MRTDLVLTRRLHNRGNSADTHPTAVTHRESDYKGYREPGISAENTKCGFACKGRTAPAGKARKSFPNSKRGEAKDTPDRRGKVEGESLQPPAPGAVRGSEIPLTGQSCGAQEAEERGRLHGAAGQRSAGGARGCGLRRAAAARWAQARLLWRAGGVQRPGASGGRGRPPLSPDVTEQPRGGASGRNLRRRAGSQQVQAGMRRCWRGEAHVAAPALQLSPTPRTDLGACSPQLEAVCHSEVWKRRGQLCVSFAKQRKILAWNMQAVLRLLQESNG